MICERVSDKGKRLKMKTSILFTILKCRRRERSVRYFHFLIKGKNYPIGSFDIIQLS